MPSSSSSKADIIPPYELQDVKKVEQPAISNQELENEVEYFSGEPQGTNESEPHGNTGRNDGSAKGNIFVNFIDGFRRQTNHNSAAEDLENELTTCVSPATLSDYKKSGDSGSVDELEGKTKEEHLKKSIKPRHVVMISLGTGIGTGLLVGNAKALNDAGPAGLAIGYAIMGSCIYCIIQAAGEMAVTYSNLVGGFNAYPSFLVSPKLGFAVAWVYWLQWACVCPLELVTASMTIKYWTTKVNPDVFVVIFYFLIIVINVFGARGYAEAEFFFNCCKVLMITGFFILGIIINCGGAGNDGYIGGKYWHDPGAFRGDKAIDRFKGVAATLVTAAFAFGGSEFIALTASEQSNPRKAIPAAAKKILYRIIIIFLGSIIMVGFLVPWNSDQLMGSDSSKTKASPYVIAISSHGVRVVPHFVNAVILLSVLSVGNSAFYSSSRILISLSQQGYAPKFFNYIDREGRPARAMVIGALFAVIAFCAASSKEEDVFTWLLAISGLSQIFTWAAICLSHIRFRRAMHVQGRSLGEIGFKSELGVWGSYYAAGMMFLVLIAQFWVGLAPIGMNKLDAQSFFESYLAMLMLIAFYVGYMFWKKDWTLFIRAKDIDLDHHRQIFDEDVLRQEDEETKEKLRNGPLWKRILNFWC
ncbi:amino acid transporter AGP1 TDEL_0C06510 [Torulaspora delbrueckii]|uniref:Amino acid permease/ SLC12A domain-containing protein n=1 Tax=Torulaspora delbrueckii TaxID=4950 RepID=G8ZQQ3_TORDE|nr:hypothetical protein TDEL_0C06510 [Torulaspora delbrueckii]CCE91540.1 hypothetical protein TDEL_0C06510 [Torulaspora delbrueckii]